MRSSKNGSDTVKDYEEFTTSRGITLQVHPVPQKIISGIVPKTHKPRRPEVEMQLPKGGVQKRPITSKDPGWDEYQEQIDAWNAEKDDLQEAVTFCLALKTYPYPKDLSFSPEIQDLIDLGMLNVPDDPYMKKFMWIRENLIGQHDELQITWIVNKLSGIPEEMIEQQKDNFRRAILGQVSPPVGNGVKEVNQTEEVSEE